MTIFRFLALTSLGVAAALTAAAKTQAAKIIILADQDTWIANASNHRDTNFNDDETVWVGGSGNSRRWGAVQFDLSGVTSPILAAHIELYALNDPDNVNFAFDQTGYLVHAPAGMGGPGMDETIVTWNNWGDFGEWETQLDSLGRLSQPEGLGEEGVGMYYATESASDDDLALLEERRMRENVEERYAFVVLDPRPDASNSKWRAWGTHEQGFAARLVLTVEGSATPGDFNDDGIVNRADIAILLQNYGQFDESFDLTGDGIVGLADLVVMQAHLTVPVADAAVPEPSAVLLAFFGLPALLAWRRYGGGRDRRTQPSP